MNLRIDKFTWGVVLVVAVLLIAAVVTVSRTNQQATTPEEYRSADEPATPVWNAYLAMQRGDIVKAREQYSERILADQKKNNYDPFTNRGYVDDRTATRLRILETQIDPDNAALAFVTISLDRYYPGGLFDGGNTSSSKRTLQVIREDDRWKVDTDEYFFY